ncbi:molybdopterin synthase subunit MoaD [Nitrosomonas oligotropha]|uniref:Molybdopterin synthase subunit MoaD n=1 Tax=Nitrosomonas oligotropha TaxID=42354 RepID=A0A2T5I365_9PROT|nr:MoaD/ThiS family protein [Nitrosomonas oligotropha]PTQ78246.1 molybdopterin synthase subunit MoaD [Nitrosomonas oligotropha]
MPITVIIPTRLRSLTNQQKHIVIEGVKVSEVIERMEQQYPGIRAKLIFDGSAYRFINIYVNDNDIRLRDGLATNVQDGDIVTILPTLTAG